MNQKNEIPEEVVEAILSDNWKKVHAVLSKLAITGNANAEHFMGWFYEQGLEVKQSDKKAFEWWSKSASKGIVESQSGLAQLYEKGRGTNTNFSEAYYWYSQAILNGDQEAQILISVLSNKMSTTELSNARTLLQTKT
ncbi:MAG: tetratricopeptide repeat protein [Pseudomonadota bacterium]